MSITITPAEFIEQISWLCSYFISREFEKTGYLDLDTLHPTFVFKKDNDMMKIQIVLHRNADGSPLEYELKVQAYSDRFSQSIPLFVDRNQVTVNLDLYFKKFSNIINNGMQEHSIRLLEKEICLGLPDHIKAEKEYLEHPENFIDITKYTKKGTPYIYEGSTLLVMTSKTYEDFTFIADRPDFSIEDNTGLCSIIERSGIFILLNARKFVKRKSGDQYDSELYKLIRMSVSSENEDEVDWDDAYDSFLDDIGSEE